MAGSMAAILNNMVTSGMDPTSRRQYSKYIGALVLMRPSISQTRIQVLVSNKILILLKRNEIVHATAVQGRACSSYTIGLLSHNSRCSSNTPFYQDLLNACFPMAPCQGPEGTVMTLCISSPPPEGKASNCPSM